jgi:enterochelin esterase family protein
MLHPLKGTVKILNHTSEVLRGNPPGDKFERELYVYLPPPYEESRDGEKSFPVVYCLTGFTGRGKMLLNDSAFSPNLAERMDKLIDSGKIKPMIAVMPDCFTHYGGSQYINSTATGNYEDYLVREIVPFTDANFRTVADRNSRAVMGKSSGGYGALVNAMRHADVFGLCASHAGDAYFEHCYLPDIPKAFRAIKGDPKKFLEKFWAEEKKGKNDFPAFNIIGMSACYSPNPEAQLGFDLPFDLQTGEIRFDVFNKWLEHDPVRMIEKYADELKSLKLLYLDAGTNDEFALDIGARIFVSRLKELDIDHIHEEFDGGHFNIGYRYDRSLELISENVE